ncbi:MAG: hypothetical protein JXA14_02210 [Anaerolineae bacterium]|nr:hypothetical protein [Anaerolineae bacterium]
MTPREPSTSLPFRKSLFDRLTTHLSRPRVLIPLGIGLVLLPTALAFVDGVQTSFFTSLWHALLIQPTVIIYILLISPFLRHAGERVIGGLRPIVLLTDEEFNRLLAEKSHADPRGELVAISVGALVSLLTRSVWSLDLDAPWIQAYHTIATIVMYTALAWVIYLGVAGPRLNRALLRQPLQVDIFDTRPFEPVGRESLLSALAFIMGATIAMVFVVSHELVLSFENLVAYGFFALVTVLVFCLNMVDTYRVLVRAKQQELNYAQERISLAYQILKHKAQQGEDIRDVAADMNAWITCKERIGKTRTWPHSTEIVGKLLASALMPVGVAALRHVGTMLLNLIELPF